MEFYIYRIVQEALRNVLKHLNASIVNIDLKSDSEKIIMIIRDKGIGFEAEEEDELLKSGKLGIIGMKERAILIGGSLNISSSEKGTVICLKVPLC